MHRAFLPLAVLSLIYFGWNLGTTSFRVSFGWDVDWSRLLLQLLYWPVVVLAWGCAAGALFSLVRGKARSLSVLSLLLALPMVGYSLYHPEYTTLKKWHYEEALKQRWFEEAQIVNHLLMKFLRENPGGLTWTGDGEGIDSSGFVAWLRKSPPVSYRAFERTYRLEIAGNAVLTPWGAPVIFGVDRDGDGYVSFAGKRGSLKAGHANPWADGNFSYSSGVGCLPESVPPNIFDPGANYLGTLNDQDFERLFEDRENTIAGRR